MEESAVGGSLMCYLVHKGVQAGLTSRPQSTLNIKSWLWVSKNVGSKKSLKKMSKSANLSQKSLMMTFF